MVSATFFPPNHITSVHRRKIVKYKSFFFNIYTQINWYCPAMGNMFIRQVL